MSIVNRIKNIAKLKGTNLFNIEKELGFSTSSIRKWDENSPSCDKIIKIASFLNVSIDYLLLGESNVENVEIENNSEDILNNDEREFIKDYRKLDLRGKTRVNETMYEEIDHIEQLGDREANWRC